MFTSCIFHFNRSTTSLGATCLQTGKKSQRSPGDVSASPEANVKLDPGSLEQPTLTLELFTESHPLMYPGEPQPTAGNDVVYQDVLRQHNKIDDQALHIRDTVSNMPPELSHHL